MTFLDAHALSSSLQSIKKSIFIRRPPKIYYAMPFIKKTVIRILLQAETGLFRFSLKNRNLFFR